MATIALIETDDEITTGVGDVVTVSASVDTGARPIFYSPDTGRRLAADEDGLGVWTATWATTAPGDYAIRVEAPLAAPVIVLVTVTGDGPPAPDYYGTDLLDQAFDARDAAQIARTGAETARTAAETARTGAQTARTGAETARDAASLIALGNADAALAAAVANSASQAGAALDAEILAGVNTAVASAVALTIPRPAGPVLTDIVMNTLGAEPVTVTVAATSQVTGTAYLPTRVAPSGNVDPAADPVYRYGGTHLPMTADAGNPANFVRANGITGGAPQAARHLHTVRFGCDAAEFEWEGRYIGGPVEYRLVVDGREAAVGTASGGAQPFIKFAFSRGARARVIDLQIVDPGWKQIKVPTGFALTKARPFLGRLVIDGDSLTAGASGVSRHRMPPNRIGLGYGIEDVWNMAVGGTGWINNGGTNGLNFKDRLATYAASLTAHDILVIIGSQNDGSAATVTANIQAALAQVTQVRRVVLVGLYRPTNPTINAAVKAGAAAAGRPFIDASNYISGTGKLATPTGIGNSDRYIGGGGGTDAVHWTQAGADYAADRLAVDLAPYILE